MQRTCPCWFGLRQRSVFILTTNLCRMIRCEDACFAKGAMFEFIVVKFVVTSDLNQECPRDTRVGEHFRRFLEMGPGGGGHIDISI